jgi:hypothetical protein
MTMVCLHCDEPIRPDGDPSIRWALWADGATTVRRVHRDCHLRSIIGGLNHLRGRCTCCGGTAARLDATRSGPPSGRLLEQEYALGSNTLTLSRKPKKEAAAPGHTDLMVSPEAIDQVVADLPAGPKRKHEKPERAKARGQWFAVLRIPRDDAYHGRPIFRHPTRETAESEAEYLAELQPGVLFVVIEAVAWHQREKPQEQAQAA